MTTLVGLHCEGQGTWIGADSQTTADNLRMGPVGKWVRKGRWAVGCAGNLRTLNLMQAETDGLLDGVRSAEEVVRRLERLMNNHNYAAATLEPFGPPAYGQSFMIASDEGLWDIDISLSVLRIPSGTVWATGSGRDFALGAGFACAEADPVQRVRVAMQAAMAYDILTGHSIVTDYLTAGTEEKSRDRRKKSLAR